MERKAITMMRVWKQWAHENETSRKSDSGRRDVTSARNHRHLICMEVKDRTSSCRQLEERSSLATGLSLRAPTICLRMLYLGLLIRVPLYRIPLTQTHRACGYNGLIDIATCELLVVCKESLFNWDYNYGRILIKRYTVERHIPECIIQHHIVLRLSMMIYVHHCESRTISGAKYTV